MQYGITPKGYRRKTYQEFLNELNSLAQTMFGEDIDLSPDNPLGKVIQILAWYGSQGEEINESIFLNQYVIYAEGKALDNAVKNIGINRKAAQPSKGTITIEGQADATVPKGFTVGTINGITFQTTETVTLTEGQATVPIISTNTGKETNVPANTITEIINPIAAVSKVYNQDPTTEGTNIETDEELRARYFRSLSIGGNATRESIEAALLNQEDIIDAKVSENTTMEEKDGIPPKSIAPLVYGGNDQKIAEIIMKSKAAGIRSYGTTEIKVLDSQQIEHTIGFTRPVETPIYVKIRIERDTGYDGDAQVKTAAIKYIGGIDADQTHYKGLQLGEAVIHSKLLAAIACSNKIKDIQVEISTEDDNYIEGNIPISKDHIAITDPEKVVITYA